MSDELPQGWASCRLGEILKLNYGKSLPAHTRRSGKFPVFGSNGVVGNHDEALTTGPTIIVGRKGSVGEICFSPVGCWPIDTTYFIDDFSDQDYNFWKYYLRTLRLANLDSSTAIPGINREDVYALEVWLPPLPEQRRIVARVEALFARTRRARADLLRVGPLAKRFRGQSVARATQPDSDDEWPVLRVAEIAHAVTGTTPPTTERGHYGGDTPFMKPTDLDAGYHVSSARTHLTASGVGASRLVPAGSTLLTCIGATIGKAGFARVDCTTNQQINALVPNRKRVDERWLYWAVTSPAFQNAIQENASATTLPILNKGRLERLSLPVAPLESQRLAADALERRLPVGEVAERVAERAIVLLNQLEQSILTRAFRGELVQQDVKDEPAAGALARLSAGSTNTIPARRGRKPRERGSVAMLSPKERIEADTQTWPPEGLTFEQVHKRHPGDYDSVQQAIFALLEGSQPRIRQHFDEKERIIRLMRVGG